MESSHEPPCSKYSSWRHSIEWLEDHYSYICQGCHQIISNSRLSSHSSRCDGLIAMNTPNPTHLQPPSSNGSPSNVPLPTFNEVCQLNLPTLPFIPTKAKTAFAKALSSTLRAVIETNTEQAWLKLLMLPKCVLLSVKRSGSHTQPHPVETLCRRWLDNEVESLWSMTKSREVKSKVRIKTSSSKSLIDFAVDQA